MADERTPPTPSAEPPRESATQRLGAVVLERRRLAQREEALRSQLCVALAEMLDEGVSSFRIATRLLTDPPLAEALGIVGRVATLPERKRFAALLDKWFSRCRRPRRRRRVLRRTTEQRAIRTAVR